MEKDEKKGSSELSIIAKGLSMILQLGISMMVPVGLCFFLGYKLDQWLSTRYFVMVFLFLGFAAGFRSVYMITKGFYAKDLEREKKEQEYFADLYRHSKKVKEDEDNSDD